MAAVKKAKDAAVKAATEGKAVPSETLGAADQAQADADEAVVSKG